MTNQQIARIMILLVLFACIANIEASQRTKQDCDQMLNGTEYGVNVLHDESTGGLNYFATWNCYRQIGIEHPEYLEKGIQLCEEEYNRTGDRLSVQNIGDIYMALGEIYNDSSKYDTAIEWYLKGCEHERRIKYNCGFEYAQIALCYALKGDTENACKWCEESNKESPGFSNCAIDFALQSYPKPTNCGYSSDNSKSSSDNGSGFPVIPLVGGFLVLVLIVAAFFLLKGKKRKGK